MPIPAITRELVGRAAGREFFDRGARGAEPAVVIVEFKPDADLVEIVLNSATPKPALGHVAVGLFEIVKDFAELPAVAVKLHVVRMQEWNAQFLRDPAADVAAHAGIVWAFAAAVSGRAEDAVINS